MPALVEPLRIVGGRCPTCERPLKACEAGPLVLVFCPSCRAFLGHAPMEGIAWQAIARAPGDQIALPKGALHG